jgi:phage baseplate assembly protein W
MARLFVGFSTVGIVPGSTKTTLYDIDLVKRDLLNRFMTPTGGRVMLPKYGTTIWQKVFEPFTDAVKTSIINDVLSVVNSDPRVILQTVTVFEVANGVGVDCTLLFQPWNVIDTFNIIFDAENQPQN